MTWLDFSGIPGVTTCWKKWSRGFGGASTKKTWKQHKRKSFPDSCVLAALLMPLARSSTLCWLLIRLASWATFFSAQLQLENAEIWHNETSGGWFFPAFLKGFWFFFWGGGGEIFWDEQSPKSGSKNLGTNWCLEDRMLMITCVLKVVPEFGQFASMLFPRGCDNDAKRCVYCIHVCIWIQYLSIYLTI